MHAAWAGDSAVVGRREAARGQQRHAAGPPAALREGRAPSTLPPSPPPLKRGLVPAKIKLSHTDKTNSPLLALKVPWPARPGRGVSVLQAWARP